MTEPSAPTSAAGDTGSDVAITHGLEGIYCTQPSLKETRVSVTDCSLALIFSINRGQMGVTQEGTGKNRESERVQVARSVPKAPLMASASCITEVALCDPNDNPSVPGLVGAHQALGLSGPSLPSASSAISRAGASLPLLPLSGAARGGPPLL